MAIFRSCIPKIFLEEKNHPYKLKTSVRHEFKQVKNPALLKFNCSESVRHEFKQVKNPALLKFNCSESVRHEFKQVKNPALRPVSTTSVKKSIFCLFYCFFLRSLQSKINKRDKECSFLRS